MSEAHIGAVSGTLLGPWYDKIYDIVHTDKRLVFVFIKELGLKDDLSNYQDDDKYSKVSLESLATREGCFAIPYASIQDLGIKGWSKESGGLHTLQVKYLDDDGKKKGSDTIIIGKAFDDRIGAFAAAEVVRELTEKKVKHPNTIIGAATTQEEVGLRGARTTAFAVKPDVCLALDVDISGDVPGIEPNEAPSKMGLGPSLTTYDSSMIPNQELVELVIKTAEKNKIPYQLAQIAQGGTDAGEIHISNAGCPSVVIGPPTRHIHSHVGMCSLRDIQSTIRLVVEVVKKLDKKTVDGLTEI